MSPVFDLTVRIVPGYGFLPIVTMDGQEVYRGEFQRTAIEAMTRARMALNRIEAQRMEAAS